MEVATFIGGMALGGVLGFVLAVFVYRQNAKKIGDLVDTVNSLKDQVRDIKK